MPLVDALVCLEPGRLQIEQREAPEPRPDEALVRPLRVGICGTDFHIYEGKHPYLNYPRIMGHELAVEVLAAPEGSGFAVGELCVVNPYISCGRCIACRTGKPNCCVNIEVLGVHRDGGMVRLLAVPSRNLIHAAGLSADQSATVEFLAIGAHAVRRGAVLPGDNVLVVGAGPIGMGAAIFAGLSGARVTLHDRDSRRLTGAASVANVNALAAGEDAKDAAMAATGGDGFDVVFDATGSAQSMEQGFDLVAYGGRYVLVSVVRETIAFSDPDFHRKEMTLLGSRNATAEDFERVISGIRSGAVGVDRLITHRTGLAGAVRDLPLWAKEKNGLIKALIEVG